MTIEIQCPGCNAVLRVDRKHAGQKGKCQQCGAAVTLPTEPAFSSRSPTLAEATPDEIVAELTTRDRSAVLVLFDTPESGQYEAQDLANAKVRCYSTDDMDDSKMLQALGNLGRIAQGIDQKREIQVEAATEKLLEFKGDHLGMSLAEFKIKHKRKTSGIGVTLPWCSSDTPDRVIQGLLAEPWHAKYGIVHARVDLPVENNSPTVAGVKTELFLYQFLDARLARMTAFFDTDSFHVVREAIAEKHGTPTHEAEHPLQFIWDKGVATVHLVRGAIRPKKASLLHFAHNRLLKEMEQRTPKKTDDL